MEEEKIEKGSFSATLELAIEYDYNKSVLKMGKYVPQRFTATSETFNKILFTPDNTVLSEYGARIYTDMLVEALSGIIHYSREKGYKKDAENLRYVIGKLEDNFVQQVSIHETHIKGDGEKK